MFKDEKTPFTWNEALIIKEKFFSEDNLEDLFSNENVSA